MREPAESVESVESTDTAATRSAYDDIAELYTELAANQLAANPLDRAMLDAFAEMVGDGAVADVGCGSGRVTAYLADKGIDISGIDLSPRMIALARQNHPGSPFREGSMEALDLEHRSLRGVLAWFSLIHLPPARVPAVIAEFHRVLEPGGHALLAFQTADAPDAVQPFDHKVVEGYRWGLDRMLECARQAGFAALARLVREPQPGERFGQGSVLVTKSA